jgi:hypothetical protein
MVEPTTVIGIVTIFGALMGTLVPYVLKVRKDPALTFDINYAYPLIINVVLQTVYLLPDDVSTLTVKGIIAAFGTGYGLQSLGNKLTPKGGRE